MKLIRDKILFALTNICSDKGQTLTRHSEKLNDLLTETSLRDAKVRLPQSLDTEKAFKVLSAMADIEEPACLRKITQAQSAAYDPSFMETYLKLNKECNQLPLDQTREEVLAELIRVKGYIQIEQTRNASIINALSSMLKKQQLKDSTTSDLLADYPREPTHETLPNILRVVYREISTNDMRDYTNYLKAPQYQDLEKLRIESFKLLIPLWLNENSASINRLITDTVPSSPNSNGGRISVQPLSSANNRQKRKPSHPHLCPETSPELKKVKSKVA